MLEEKINKMNNSWSVIRFPDENAVEAVPTTWLCGNNCFWPPWSKDRINTAIKNCKPPDVESWQKYPFTSFRNNVFGDYDSARKKIEKATFISDLDSQADSHSEAERRRKRKTVKTTFTRFASYEMSEADSDDAPSILPIPPKYKGIEKKKQGKQFPDGNDRDKNVETAMLSASDDTESNEDYPPNTLPVPSKYNGIEKLKQRKLFTDGNNRDKNVGTAMAYFVHNAENNEITNRPTPIIPSGNSTTELQHITGYLKQIIRKQNIIQSTLSDQGEDIAEIKRKIDQKNVTDVDNSQSMFTILNLPINSVTDLENLEDYLNEDVQMNSAVREVAASGGKDVYELVYRTTQKLVTNRFASNYSYFGRQKKSKFSSLKLNELLKKAALKNFPNSSEKEAEVAIAKWLRRCTERAKKEQI